jgi:hypothetical protein
VQVRADRDSEARTGGDVDVRIGAAQADQAQVRQAFEQRRADPGPLANQDKRLEAGKPLGEGIGVLDVVCEDRHVVAGEPLEALERPQRVEPVVEDRDLHRIPTCTASSIPSRADAESLDLDDPRTARAT